MTYLFNNVLLYDNESNIKINFRISYKAARKPIK